MGIRGTSSIAALVAAALIGACSSAERQEQDQEASGDALTSAQGLERAREAIARRDFGGAAALLRDVIALVSPGGASEAQALALVDRIYDENGGAAVPVADTFPPELEGMRVTIGRALRRPNEVGDQPGDHVLSIALAAPFALRDRIRDLKVTKLPSKQVVLDAADASQWGLGINRDDPKAFLGKTLPADFAADGLYGVDVTLNDPAATQVSSWFILTGAIASNDPTTNSPTNQNLTLERPAALVVPADATFSFDDFRSERFKPFEERKAVAILRYHQFIRGQRSTSSYFKGELQDPSTVELRAGNGAVPLLVGGEYRFAVDHQETRPFGRFRIGRSTQTIVRFFSGPPPLEACETIGDQATCETSHSRDRGVCVWGFQGRGCMGVGDTNPIAGRCDILRSPAACSFHNVSCVWSEEACIRKP